MKIYTKTGDGGMTSIIGRRRISKNSRIIEAIGDVDELNSLLGLLHSKIDILKYKEDLVLIQHKLFNIGAILASSDDTNNLPAKIEDNDILWLENKIDEMDKNLPNLKNFILPTGTETASLCFLVRGVCRRGERSVVSLTIDNIPTPAVVLRYLNRLSDFFFVLARSINYEDGVEEVIWNKDI